MQKKNQKQRSQRQRKNYRTVVSAALRNAFGPKWQSLFSVLGRGQVSYMFRLRDRKLDEDVRQSNLQRLDEVMTSLANRVQGWFYDPLQRVLSYGRP